MEVAFFTLFCTAFDRHSCTPPCRNTPVKTDCGDARALGRICLLIRLPLSHFWPAHQDHCTPLELFQPSVAGQLFDHAGNAWSKYKAQLRARGVDGLPLFDFSSHGGADSPGSTGVGAAHASYRDPCIPCKSLQSVMSLHPMP